MLRVPEGRHLFGFEGCMSSLRDSRWADGNPGLKSGAIKYRRSTTLVVRISFDFSLHISSRKVSTILPLDNSALLAGGMGYRRHAIVEKYG